MASDPQSRSRSLFIAWFVLVLTAGWVAFIWTFRFLPLQDYPGWTYAGRLFSLLIRNQAPSCYQLVRYPVPNALFVATTGLLDLVFRPETSGKIFLSLSVVLFALGSFRLVGSTTTRRDTPLLLLPLIFVFNRSVPVGEISYEFSLGVLFLAMAQMLYPPERARGRELWLIAGFSLVIFLSHAASFFCWLIFLLLLTVFDSSRFPRFKTLLSVSPSLLLFVLYVLGREKSGGGLNAASFIGDLKSKVVFVSIFSPLHFFDPFYWTDPKLLKQLSTAFNLSVVAVVLILALIWMQALRSHVRLSARLNGTTRAVLVAPLVFSAVFLFAPFSEFTGVYDLNGRFLLPAFLLMLAGLASFRPRALSERMRWSLTLATAAAAIFVLAFQFFYVGRVAGKLQGVYDVLSQAHLDPDFRAIADSEFEHLDYVAPLPKSGPRLLPVHESLAYFVQYLRLEHPTCVPLFQTTTSIVRASVPYRSLLTDTEGIAELPRGVVILGLQNRNRVIAGLLTDRYQTVADTDYVLVLERKAAPGKAPVPARTP